jgi:adenylate kinase family enzyme
MGLYFIFKRFPFQEGGWFSRQGVRTVAVKMFLLGRPGSGKSTTANWIKESAQDAGLSAARISDYAILYDMFLKGSEQFETAEYGGFNVKVFSVLDTALEKVQKKAQEQIDLEENKVVLIEFARDDYSKALQFFDYGLLQNAYFLFLDAGIEACKSRIYRRTFTPSEADEFHDNHFVSEKIIDSYYQTDHKPESIARLVQAYRLDCQKVKIISNNGSLEDFHLEIKKIAKDLLLGKPLWGDYSPFAWHTREVDEQEYNAVLDEQALASV